MHWPYKQHKTSRNQKLLPYHEDLKKAGACFGVSSGYERLKDKSGKFTKIDFDVVMTLPLRDYLPAYALILGGPLSAVGVYIAGRTFKRPLNKLSSGKWRVWGSLDDIKAEFVEWFE